MIFMMTVMTQKPTMTDNLAQLEEHLETKYLYSRELFRDRVKYLKLPKEDGKPKNNAVEYHAFAGAPFLLAVVLPESELRNSVRQSALNYARNCSCLGILVFYDSKQRTLEVLRKKHSTNEFELSSELEYYNKKSSSQGFLFPNDELLPVTNKLENIFFEIHSTIRDIDGLHSDAALEELCKLLQLKSYLEDESQPKPIKAIQTHSFGNTEELASCLRAMFLLASASDITKHKSEIPGYQSSRGVFQEPFTLSSAALVQAFQQIQRYTLRGSETDIKGRAFQRVLTKSIRSGLGQYFTPSPVCTLMVSVVCPLFTEKLIDPFCGSGHFLSLSFQQIKDTSILSQSELNEYSRSNLYGIEKSERMVRVAMTDMRMHGDGHSNIQCSDSLLDFRNYPDLQPRTFDVVLTNPPFGSILGEEAFKSLAQFELAKGRKRVPLEVVGLERAIELLKPGGRIAIVLPDSIFSSESCRYVRDWLLKVVRPRAVIDLPAETFCPFGANVQSGILIARKLMPGEIVDVKDKVCMIKLDDIGYDSTGRATNKSDVDSAILKLRTFLSKEGW
jgi:type I restriction enzyme M protein